jgi:hypothetical protein
MHRELARVVHRRIMHERGQNKPFEGVADNDRDRLICQSEQRKCSFSDPLGDGVIAIDYDSAEALLELTPEDVDVVSAAFVEAAVMTLADAIASAGVFSVEGRSDTRYRRLQEVTPVAPDAGIGSAPHPRLSVAPDSTGFSR